MHHLKETVIDGVKFVLIPEEMKRMLMMFVATEAARGNQTAMSVHKAFPIEFGDYYTEVALDILSHK